jgi:hypothetical protein
VVAKDHTFKGEIKFWMGFSCNIECFVVRFLNIWTDRLNMVSGCYLDTLKDQTCVERFPVKYDWLRTGLALIYSLFGFLREIS